ncbi:MAG: Protein AaeX [Pseudomonas sp.]|nr:MAG: Protein AaeX [Pseudomonas sp.]
MPREIAFHGLYMPTVTLMFLIAAGVAWAVDRWLAGYDLYRFFWHPALLRLSLFFCLFGALALTVYR